MVNRSQTQPVARLDPPVAEEGGVRLRLRLGEAERSARFACAGEWLAPNPDAAFVAGLPVAMGLAPELDLPDGVSPLLLANAGSLQRLLAAWNPPLREIELRPGAPAPPPPAPSGRTAAFFTGGVDSFYTVLTRREQIDALVFAHGFDLAPGEAEKRALVSASLHAVAAQLELPLIELDTDLRAFSDSVCDWERVYTSAALATVGHLLADRFDRVLIPATHSLRDLHPTGTHPLLDPLYSSDRLRVEHVDAITRVEKLEYLVDSELAMSSLRVCFQSGVEGLNCGACPKCMRTMAGLRVVGAPGRCKTLPGELSLRVMASGKVRSRRSLTYVRENLEAVQARGTDPELEFALRLLVERGARTEAWAEARRLAATGRRAARGRLAGLVRRAWDARRRP